MRTAAVAMRPVRFCRKKPGSSILLVAISLVVTCLFIGLLRLRLRCQADLRDAQPSQNVKNIHNSLILSETVATDYDWKIRGLRLLLVEALLELLQSHRDRIQKYLAFVVERNRLGFWFS